MANKNYRILEVMTFSLPGQAPGQSFESVAGGIYTLDETIGDAMVAAGKAEVAPDEDPAPEPAPEA